MCHWIKFFCWSQHCHGILNLIAGKAIGGYSLKVNFHREYNFLSLGKGYF